MHAGRAYTSLAQDVNTAGDSVDKPLFDRHGGLELRPSFLGRRQAA